MGPYEMISFTIRTQNTFKGERKPWGKPPGVDCEGWKTSHWQPWRESHTADRGGERCIWYQATHPRFSQMHKIGNNGINANFVLLYIYSFLLYFHQVGLANMKLNISGFWRCILKFQSSLVLFTSYCRAKTKLAILPFLYYGEFMKTSN